MTTLSSNAIEILKDRYLLRDLKGTIIETPEALFQRVAKHIASAEDKDEKYWLSCYYDLMKNLKFLPNSPTLMNAGLPKGQLSACFVLPIEDSLESIFTTLKNAALIHQSGGGTGYNFSKLRPEGDLVTGAGGTSSGPVAFMKIFDAATEYVKQGGKRRGANMGILNINHPDIEAFIIAKTSGLTLSNFNISVGISDHFMNAVSKNKLWPLINPHNGKVQKQIPAISLWEMIIKEAWKTGDPGLIFLDAINKNNPTPYLGAISSTNPCGEVPLLDYESCNLGSLNLVKVLEYKKGKATINWSQLEDMVKIAIRFLDNVIIKNHYLLPEIDEKTKMNRKIGLGVMGWAEMLMLLEIPYASEEAVLLAGKLMKFIKEKSYAASENLAKERGGFYRNKNRRNATCNSIAPTGTISVIANTSYSIEPLYALAYNRVGILGGKKQQVFNHIFVNKMKSLNLWNESLKNEILASGSIQDNRKVPKNVKRYFQTSLEIPWEYHLQHQLAFQNYTDNAVSKTINLPQNSSQKDIASIYLTAWKSGLKGITVYRDKSKVSQVLQKCNLNGSVSC
ncbi:adenosylcobalamin-dependent ribonucleoside-diphosphate reductase [Ascidiimonas sp. W6]|uniref:adenosylcobalamin-dependent ribonucleoside-diphosphate reductase n=1 Tax=Ascidiimonas meishanensis TaxID=3128903 RepID=UPI0030EE534F